MLSGKTALVTGGSRGIGAAIACRFAAMGAQVAVVYAGDRDSAEKACRICREQRGNEARAYRCDVSSYQEAQRTVDAVKRDFGGIDILVNNAGITRDGVIAMMGEDDFKAVIDVNLTGAFNMIRHCARHFMRSREGCIINISSVSGLMGNAGQANYAASKAGLVGLTKSVAKELASRGIRCNAIAPGFIRTQMTEPLEAGVLVNDIPLGRMGEPSDVADAAAFLATAGYVTGEVIRVDGGIAM